MTQSPAHRCVCRKCWARQPHTARAYHHHINVLMSRMYEPQRRSRVAFLPFTLVVRKILIPKGFQGALKTVGEHILKKRLDDGLSQGELGKRLGVNASLS